MFPGCALDDEGAARVSRASLGAIRAGAQHVAVDDVAPESRLPVHAVADGNGVVEELGPLQAARNGAGVANNAPSDDVELLVLHPRRRVRLRQHLQGRVALERRLQDDQGDIGAVHHVPRPVRVFYNMVDRGLFEDVASCGSAIAVQNDEVVIRMSVAAAYAVRGCQRDGRSDERCSACVVPGAGLPKREEIGVPVDVDISPSKYEFCMRSDAGSASHVRNTRAPVTETIASS